ncbi:MAG: M23 family metallopeptidase [Oscillospiraceae bacterium]|nr:M23 family metallopeptidase [Oscillospiraceae bacterium]
MNKYTEILNNIEPVSSDEAFVNSVLRRGESKQSRKSPFAKQLVPVMLALIILFGGGVAVFGNSDRFNAALSYLFGEREEIRKVQEDEYKNKVTSFFNNSAAAAILAGQPEYTLVSNDFKNFDFEILGLYADGGIISMAVDVKSNKKSFSKDDNSHAVYAGFQIQQDKSPSEEQLAKGFNHQSGGADFIKVNDRQIIALFIWNYFDDLVIGEEMTLLIHSVETDEGTVFGEALFKFNIDMESFNRKIEVFTGLWMPEHDPDSEIGVINTTPVKMTLSPNVLRLESSQRLISFDYEDVSLKYKNGDVVSVMENFYGSVSGSNMPYIYHFMFKESIDIEQVEFIIINSQELSLESVDLELIFPVGGNGGYISEYGHWDGGYTGHQGIDISADYGTEILAAADGEVIYANWNGGYGNIVIIKHDNGLSTVYAHCSEIFAEVGDEVTQGQVIAAVGATGQALGNQLHFEVRQGEITMIEGDTGLVIDLGPALNPMDFLPKDVPTNTTVSKPEQSDVINLSDFEKFEIPAGALREKDLIFTTDSTEINVTISSGNIDNLTITFYNTEPDQPTTSFIWGAEAIDPEATDKSGTFGSAGTKFLTKGESYYIVASGDFDDDLMFTITVSD